MLTEKNASAQEALLIFLSLLVLGGVSGDHKKMRTLLSPAELLAWQFEFHLLPSP